MAFQPVSYFCPYCGAPLKEASASLNCAACKKFFEIRDGIAVLIRDPSYYYGEVSQDKMREILSAAESGDWRLAFERLTSDMKYSAYHAQYAFSERRAGWWPLLDLNPQSRVLDYGCGWGPLSHALAKRAGMVVSLDACFERLKFWRIRAKQERLSNIQFLWAGDTPRLPFADQQFDLVVLNGVLEWIPASQKEDPGKIQKSFLREVARILSPNGQLMLAMENRYNWYYFLGKPEDHAGIRYVSILPRFFAALYSKMRTGDIYRNYTYSYWGHKRLLKSVGFSGADVLVPLPDYRLFRSVVDPSRPATVERFFAERDSTKSSRTLSRVKAFTTPLLAPSFCVVAHRGTPQPAFALALAREIAVKLGANSAAAQWMQLRVSRADAILLEIDFGSSHPPVIVKLPMNNLSLARCQSEVETLDFAKSTLPQDEAALIPRSFSSGIFRGVHYFVQQMFSGITGNHVLRKPSENAWKYLGVDFLSALHRRTQQRLQFEGAVWKELVQPKIAAGLDIIQNALHLESACIEEFLLANLGGKTWPFCFTHGDFWAGNLVLADGGRRLAGVIDWDRSERPGLPMFDILHFVIFSNLESQPRGRNLPGVIGDALNAGRANFSDVEILNRYLEKMDTTLNSSEFAAFLTLYWVHLISVWRTTGRSENVADTDWVRNFVEPARPWLERELPKIRNAFA